MKGDFSRFTFNPPGHYTQLPLQQGRVLVDADWNEQAEIALHDRRVITRASIGPSGGPLERAALRLEVVANVPWLGVGGASAEPFNPASPTYTTPAFYWVEGCTLTQERAWPLEAQPHLAPALPTNEGYYLAWVDAFERLLTALDMPEIREQAMGGPDHGSRVQQVWQVRLRPFASPVPPPGDPDCFDLPADWRPPAPTGRMHARVADPVTSEDPCVVPRTAGYRRLENQLYRIEIRDGGNDGAATFVWSRDNGIVRVRATAGSYKEAVGTGDPSLQVAELGRDELTRLTAGDWVEITDEARTLAGLPGYLCQISGVSSTALSLDKDNALSKLEFDALKAPSVRRWDTVDEAKHVGASYLGGAVYRVSDALAADPDRYFDLEDGVQVRFAPGSFRTGDYWLVPARTTSGNVEYAPTPQLPHGVRHHAAALGILHRSGAGVWRVVRDCRNLFPPLTRLSQLHYVGGDGQEALPGGLLGGRLEVAVTNGTTPIEGADIIFDVRVPGGTLDNATERRARGYLLEANAAAPSDIDGRLTRTVKTDPQGIAAVRWVLGAFDMHSNGGWAQHVSAKVDRHGPGDPTGEIHFHATQSIAREVQVDVTACPTNEEDPVLKTVQELMGTLGLDPANAQHQNVQHVLHQLLCRLNARHVPYVFPATPAEITPATVDQVKSALDALYWLVLQREGCCCLSDVIKKLAELLSGKQGDALCKALQEGVVEGECSLLEITLGALLNLVRVVYAVVLAFLDLQDAPGPNRGYDGLKLGNESGIELEAFIQGEGPGWFATRVEERSDQVRALGDQALDVVKVALERVFEARGIDGALKELAERYGQETAAYNGPATRHFVLHHLWEPLFNTRRLDDVALLGLRELLLAIVRRLWQEFVELLLCGEPLPTRIPTPTWLPAIEENLGRALERTFNLHGLVRELPTERWGTPRDVHMVAPSELYPSGATWVVSNATDEEGRNQTHLLRWRHMDGTEGPLPALEDRRLPDNQVLPEPDLVISVLARRTTSLSVLDSGARRQSLHMLAEVDTGDGKTLLLWWLPSADVAAMEGEVEDGLTKGQPRLGKSYTHPGIPVGGTVLVAGGPDDPPAVVGWPAGDAAELNIWPPTVREVPYVIDTKGLLELGLPREPPLGMHAFALDAKGPRPGRYVAVALIRQDRRQDQLQQRNVLLLVEGRSAQEANPILPWWEAERMVSVMAWDLPMGVRVVGGAHDLVALQDDGGRVDPDTGEPSERRWTFVSVGELLGGAFPTEELPWDETPPSRGITEIPAERWRRGDMDSVVHGNDGPWVQALGPLTGRLGLYRAWSSLPPLLQRQMVRGAAVGETALSQVEALFTKDDAQEGDDQVLDAEVNISHDYLLADSPSPRLLTVCIASGNGTPLIEFNASPRS